MTSIQSLEKKIIFLMRVQDRQYKELCEAKNKIKALENENLELHCKTEACKIRADSAEVKVWNIIQIANGRTDLLTS